MPPPACAQRRATPLLPPRRAARALAAVLAAALLPLATPSTAQVVPGGGINHGAQARAGSNHNGGAGYLGAESTSNSRWHQADATGSLEGASLHAKADTARQRPGCLPYHDCHWYASARVAIWEQVTLTRDMAKGGDGIVRFSYVFSGEKGRHSAFGQAWAKGAYYFGPDRAVWQHGGSDVTLDGVNSFGGSFRVLDQPLTMYFYAELDVAAQDGGFADWGNSLHFGWDLPEGVGYTSSSGRFWAPPVSAVPEPAGAAMLGAGLLLLATLRRRGGARGRGR